MATDSYRKTGTLRAQIDLDDIAVGFRKVEGQGLVTQLRIDLTDEDGRIETKTPRLPVLNTLTADERAALIPILKKCAVALVAQIGLTKE